MGSPSETRSPLVRELEKLKPHDHLCLVYESPEEWEAVIIPFIRIGLERKEKCIYVADAHTADELRGHLTEAGIDVPEIESRGQLSILPEDEVYTAGGSFDPDRIIQLLINETEKAVGQGYPALRVTSEMTWVSKGVAGSERLLEYEAKLNRDFFPQYPCLAICQYDRQQFDPEVIKDVIKTHPKLIYGTRMNTNFYYVPPDGFLNHKRSELEVQQLLNNICHEEKRKEGLVASEVRYRRLFEAAKDGIMILNSESGRVEDINPYLLDLLGYSKDDLLGKHLWELGLFKDRLRSHNSFCDLKKSGYIHYDDLQLDTKDGRDIDVEFVSNTYLVNGEMVIQCNIRNITRRKEAEKELKLRAKLLDNAVDSIFLHTLDGKFIYVNAVACQSLGYSKGELLKINLSAITVPGVDIEAQWKQLLDKGQAVFESIQLRKDGSIMPVEVHTRIVEVGNDKLILSVVHDTSERKKAEESLRNSEARYRSLLNNLKLGIIRVTVEPPGIILEVNPAMEEITGYTKDELIGMDITKLYLRPGDRDRILDQLYSSGVAINKELPWLKKDGSQISIMDRLTLVKDSNGKLLYLDAIIEDVTWYRAMQEQLLLNDRLASVGELASGIAHELNNPLTAVMGFSELLLEKDLASDVKEDLQTVYDEAQRAGKIVKNLLTFARKHPVAKQLMSVNSAIEEVLELRAYEHKLNNIQVVKNFAPDLPEIKGDLFQLEQVLLNIICNAEYFMIEAHGGGTLTITTEQADNLVRILLADDGPGLEKGKKGYIFDPFFTTKPVGKGTGLGLSISHGIVSNHGGTIYAQSELGEGTTFIMELPIRREDE